MKGYLQRPHAGLFADIPFSRVVITSWIILAAAVTAAAHEPDTREIYPRDANHSDAEDNEYGSMTLEDLLTVRVIPGLVGGFARQLKDVKVKPYLHGYVAFFYRTNDLNRNKKAETFSLQYFNILVGADIGERLTTEVLLEYEHGGDDMGLRYGIVDYKVADPLILRLGKFLVPMGKFNEYYYPEYINKLADRPRVLWNVVPSVWAEIGVQARGRYNFTSEQSVNYALYVVNGLEQRAKADGNVAEGGDIRDMRHNHRDYSDNGKAYGGRLGFKPTTDLEFGASFYTGAYTVDGRQDLTIVDLDASYEAEKITIKGEYVQALQQTSAADLRKDGFYAEAAYRIDPYWEPVIRYDQADLANRTEHDVRRTTLGVIIYPEPELKSPFNFKVNYSFIHDNGFGETDNEFVVQVVIAF